MKLALASSLVVAFASFKAQAVELRGAPQHVRNLDLVDGLTYYWLVSNIDTTDDLWCLAVKSTNNFAKLGFEKCDLSGPLNQLWHIDDDGMLHAGVSFSQCMITGFGTSTTPPITMRHAACDTDTDLNEFVYDTGSKQLSPAALPDLCVVNRGVTANPSDTILAIECQDEGRFQWDLREYEDGGFTYVSTSPQNFPGCIGAAGGTAKSDSKLILQDCIPSATYQKWRVDEDGLIRLQMGGDTKCIQSSREEPPKDGQFLRIYDCDPDNELQQFTWDIANEGPIQPVADDSLCVVFRGVDANLDVDPIIFKKCDIIEPERLGWTAI